MTQTRQDASQEQRRLLLKGALGASTVMTLGYGGAVAAASLTCIAKVDGGYPLEGFQFRRTAPSNLSTGNNWAWKRVDIWACNGAGSFDGFTLDGVNFYTAPEVAGTAPEFKVGGKKKTSQPNGYPKDGWVLVYFYDNGDEKGSYPAVSAQSTGYAPAVESCLNSINAGILINYTFGG